MSGRIFNSIASWAIKKRIHQIELFIKHPIEVQNDVLHSLLEQARNSEWGKKFDYDSIGSIEEYKQRVPISQYEDLFPWIDRMMQGEQNLLWSEDIKWFSKSSGTTNAKSKFIPVSKSTLEDCHYKGGKDLISIYLNNRLDSKLFSGKSLVLGGSNANLYNDKQVFVGDVSAVIMQNLPIWAEWVRTPDLKTALLDNYEDKIEKLVEKSVRKNVTSLAGVPTWTIVLIQKILEQTGKDNILEIWPNLEAYFHGGVNFGPYRSLFKTLIPSDKIRYVDSYNASEGFFGIQDRSEADDMLLMLDYGIYYEFMPVSEGLEYDFESAQTIALDQVQLNQNYALIISTNSGLWRYFIGDTVKFTSLNPYRIKITGRTKHFMNAFGEELIIENADEAIQYACNLTKSKLKDYTAAPIYFDENNSQGAHEWLIEFEIEPERLEDFVVLLDVKLKEVNSDYEAKRVSNLALKQPIVKVLPKGTFYKWMEKRGKVGGQNKVPRLSNDRNFINGITKVL